MLILASASPRRRELLAQIGLNFVMETSAAEEITAENLPPDELAKENAKQKALAVAAIYPGFPVLGADTVVYLDGHIYGKPKDAADAARMLRLLSGREHEVITGLALVNEGRLYETAAVTKVRFAPMTEEDIANYVATGEPMDKAGAYAVQGIGACFIEGICGSYSNVVGLPLYDLRLLAKEAGISLLA